MCKDPNHFHGDDADADHMCDEEHACIKMCDAPGCKSQCGLSRADNHEVHRCARGDSRPCLFTCRCLVASVHSVLCAYCTPRSALHSACLCPRTTV